MEDWKNTDNVKVEENAELNGFSANAKSSVKIIKNSRGINWEIKIVTGENDLIDGLVAQAVASHTKLKQELEGGKK